MNNYLRPRTVIATYRAVVLDAVVPEVLGRELVANGHRVAPRQAKTGPDDSSGKMIQRDAGINHFIITKLD